MKEEWHLGNVQFLVLNVIRSLLLGRYPTPERTHRTLIHCFSLLGECVFVTILFLHKLVLLGHNYFGLFVLVEEFVHFVVG